MTTESAMFVLLVVYQGTDLRIPARTSRARTRERRTAQLSKERRRFAGVDINAAPKQVVCEWNREREIQISGNRRGEISDNNSRRCGESQMEAETSCLQTLYHKPM